ncbi:MAG TPA: hypothetical protein VMC42_01580 [Methanoregulaceae archaeon]|nr:hypothetical protein [Methanoregulaceae archaeon]
MRIAGVSLVVIVLLGAAMATGCVSVYPGDVAYTGSGIMFLVHSDKAVPDAFVEAAVFSDEGFSREEIYRFSGQVPLQAGETAVTIPVSLKPGHYRCFIHTSSGMNRFPAVIRDFEVP